MIPKTGQKYDQFAMKVVGNGDRFWAPFKCWQFWVTHMTTEITENTERGKISVFSVISVVENLYSVTWI
jgi:hypothetical protein